MSQSTPSARLRTGPRRLTRADALIRACPTCGATAGTPCFGVRDYVRTSLHAERYRPETVPRLLQ